MKNPTELHTSGGPGFVLDNGREKILLIGKGFARRQVPLVLPDEMSTRSMSRKETKEAQRREG